MTCLSFNLMVWTQQSGGKEKCEATRIQEKHLVVLYCTTLGSPSAPYPLHEGDCPAWELYIRNAGGGQRWKKWRTACMTQRIKRNSTIIWIKPFFHCGLLAVTIRKCGDSSETQEHMFCKSLEKGRQRLQTLSWWQEVQEEVSQEHM